MDCLDYNRLAHCLAQRGLEQLFGGMCIYDAEHCNVSSINA